MPQRKQKYEIESWRDLETKEWANKVYSGFFDKPRTVKEAAAHLKMPRPTLFVITKSLFERGYIQKAPQGGYISTIMPWIEMVTENLQKNPYLTEETKKKFFTDSDIVLLNNIASLARMAYSDRSTVIHNGIYEESAFKTLMGTYTYFAYNAFIKGIYWNAAENNKIVERSSGKWLKFINEMKNRPNDDIDATIFRLWLDIKQNAGVFDVEVAGKETWEKTFQRKSLKDIFPNYREALATKILLGDPSLTALANVLILYCTDARTHMDNMAKNLAISVAGI